MGRLHEFQGLRLLKVPGFEGSRGLGLKVLEFELTGMVHLLRLLNPLSGLLTNDRTCNNSS